LQDPVALGRAIADAHAVQVICPPMPRALDAVGDMRKSIESVAKALEQERPDLVLAISDYGAHVDEDIGMPTMFRIFEEHLRRLETPRIFLRSAEHMEGWGAVIPVAIAMGILPSFHHPVEKPFPTVSAQDVGRIAANLLVRPGADIGTRIVHAEGPRRYSTADVAAALCELLGRPVTAQTVPRSQWMENLGRVVSASTARLLAELYDAHNRRGLIDIEPDTGDVRHGATELIDALRPLVPR
jgi:uncharacterized protein YbjT (DUF2867 family)